MFGSELNVTGKTSSIIVDVSVCNLTWELLILTWMLYYIQVTSPICKSGIISWVHFFLQWKSWQRLNHQWSDIIMHCIFCVILTLSVGIIFLNIGCILCPYLYSVEDYFLCIDIGCHIVIGQEILHDVCYCFCIWNFVQGILSLSISVKEWIEIIDFMFF